VESIRQPAGEEERMCHEARRSKLERKLFSHSPEIGWCLHRTSHVLLRASETSTQKLKGVTDIGQDCLGYHVRYNFIEYVPLQGEILDLIRLKTGLRNSGKGER
jgi:hypothetical protein